MNEDIYWVVLLALKREGWGTKETRDILASFAGMLALPTGDGAAKRQAGLKPSWEVDDSHLPAVFSHLNKHFQGETTDAESGADTLTHCAWRLLAIAWQKENRDWRNTSA